jgi:MSHA pilin protein MshC
MLWMQVKARPQGRVFADQSGFSVIELVVTMVILGILAATAMPRFVGVSSFEAMGYADSLMSAARYAQKSAMNSGCDTRVVADANGYALWLRATGCTSGGFSRPLPRPGAEQWQEQAPSGLTLSALDIYFDADGSPYDTSSGALLNSANDVTVGNRTLRIEPVTGLVHLL